MQSKPNWDRSIKIISIDTMYRMLHKINMHNSFNANQYEFPLEKDNSNTDLKIIMVNKIKKRKQTSSTTEILAENNNVVIYNTIHYINVCSNLYME